MGDKHFEVTAASGLNIRAWPGMDEDVIKAVPKGKVLVSPGGWIPVYLDEDTIGWCSADYLKQVQVAATPAPLETPLIVTAAGPHLRQNQLPVLFGKPRDPARYLKIMDFTEFKNDLSHVRDYEGNPWSCRIYGHELMETPLRRAFRNIIDQGYAGEWMTYDGCLNIERYSPCHNYGMAIDLNARTNALGDEPELSPGFVECFTVVGFEWGGDWSRPDGMHFQWPWISRS